MEDAFDLYSAVVEQGFEGFERIYEDKKNETGHELFIYGQTVSSKGSSKVQATKQVFKLKCKPEEFFFVSNDVETQKRVNTNLSMIELLFSKKTSDYTLELLHSKSKKILMIDSRESLYIKYCKRITDKHIVSLGKSILLGDVANEKRDLVTNIQLTAFAYKYSDEDPSSPYTQIEVYNSTDFRSSVGLTLLKPVISKNVKELLKKNVEEIERLRKEDPERKMTLFESPKTE